MRVARSQSVKAWWAYWLTLAVGAICRIEAERHRWLSVLVGRGSPGMSGRSRVFGNWLHAEELAEAAAFRGLRKPRVPVKLIEPVPDDTLR